MRRLLLVGVFVVVLGGCGESTETTCSTDPPTGAVTCTETKTNDGLEWAKDHWYYGLPFVLFGIGLLVVGEGRGID